MKNWIDSAKKIRGSPKFAVRGQMARGAYSDKVGNDGIDDSCKVFLNLAIIFVFVISSL